MFAPNSRLRSLVVPSFNGGYHLDDATIAKFQREVGNGYFDDVAQAIAGGATSTLALEGSTEKAQS